MHDVDPWYDFLAFPAAPLVLVAQAVGLALPPPWRQAVSLAALVAFVVMLVIVFVVPAGGGANIGAGILAIALAVSLAIAVRAFADRGGG